MIKRGVFAITSIIHVTLETGIMNTQYTSRLRLELRPGAALSFQFPSKRAIFAILGLLLSLFTRQRRIWVKVSDRVEIAGLAKNAAPGLAKEISDLKIKLEGK